MRIAFTGNTLRCEEALPVAKARAAALKERCEKAGLSQDVDSYFDSSALAVVRIVYVFGELQVFISAEFESREEAEEKEEKREVPEHLPGTFYMITTGGFFWIKPKVVEGKLVDVELEAFEGIKINEETGEYGLRYPGIGLFSWGMLAGCIDDDPRKRYVITQRRGVLVGEKENKGTIKMPPMLPEGTKITTGQTNAYGANPTYCLISNSKGQRASVSVLSVKDNPAWDKSDPFYAIELKVSHAEIDMLLEGEGGNLTIKGLKKYPCFVHRKCSGSYFSPNKTIGFHVDIGTSDDFFGNPEKVGNALAIPGAFVDHLNNGLEGSSGFAGYFNHTYDLFRFAELLAGPLTFSHDSVSLYLCMPSMIWDHGEDRCWGGYGATQSLWSVIDLMKDFGRSVLSPRIVKVDYSIKTGKILSEIEVTGTLNLFSWDRKHKALASISSSGSCSNSFTEDGDTYIMKECEWSEEFDGGACSFFPENNNTFEGERGLRFEALHVGHEGFREKLSVSRQCSFSIGSAAGILQPDKMFYLRHRGRWHVSFGGFAYRANIITERCGICSMPPFAAAPESKVLFYMPYADEHIIENAVATVEGGLVMLTNLELMEYQFPLNPKPSTVFGFLAYLPEELKAPTPPQVLTAKVSYTAKNIKNITIVCENSIMSQPCICPEYYVGFPNFFYAGPGFTSFVDAQRLYGRFGISGGCAPYNVRAQVGDMINEEGVNVGKSVSGIDGGFFEVFFERGTCEPFVEITDVCGGVSVLKDVNEGGQVGIEGPEFMLQGTEAEFYHGMGESVKYTGALPVVEELDQSYILRMPDTQEDPVTIKFEGDCDWWGEITVTPGYCDCDEVSEFAWSCAPAWCSWLTPTAGEVGVVGGCGPFNWSVTGGGHFIGSDGESKGSHIHETYSRHFKIAAPADNCKLKVTVTDTKCDKQVDKEASREGGEGAIEGPKFLAWGGVGEYFHNMGSDVAYYGGLNFISQQPGKLTLQMPEGATGTQTIHIMGVCGITGSYDVEPHYCKCPEAGPLHWAQDCCSISYGGRSLIHFGGGCAPFTWLSSNVRFEDANGAPVSHQLLRSRRSAYAVPTDPCHASVTIYDTCGSHLNVKYDNRGGTFAVVGPAVLQPGQRGYYTHNGPADAKYTGSLRPIEVSGQSAILEMPKNTKEVFHTASWKGTCNAAGSLVVTTVTLNPSCTWRYHVPCCGPGCGVASPIRLPDGTVRVSPDNVHSSSGSLYNPPSYMRENCWVFVAPGNFYPEEASYLHNYNEETNWGGYYAYGLHTWPVRCRWFYA